MNNTPKPSGKPGEDQFEGKRQSGYLFDAAFSAAAPSSTNGPATVPFSR